MIQIISRTHSISSDAGATLDDRDVRGRPTNDVRRELERATVLQRRGEDLIASFTITVEEAEVYGQSRPGVKSISLYRDKGIRPSVVMEDADQRGSLYGELHHRLSQRKGAGYIGAILRVEMTFTAAP